MVFAALAFGPVAAEDAQNRPVRLVVAGGCMTEIVFAFGQGDKVVGVDSSSIYPEAATGLPQIGYLRALSSEGILGLSPTLVLTTRDAGPPHALEQIEQAGVRVAKLDGSPTQEACRQRIHEIGKLFNRPHEAKILVEKLDGELAGANRYAEKAAAVPARVLFVYARGGGILNVSGKGTAADAMIQLSGARNAITEFEGYRPLTPEAVVTAAPEVILLTTRGLESVGGPEGLFAQPGLALTPAGRHRRFVALDDLYLLGFGPRLGEAVLELCQKLHPSR